MRNQIGVGLLGAATWGAPGEMIHETLTANVVFEGQRNPFGGELELVGGDYQADVMSSSEMLKCGGSGTESGNFPESGSGMLGFEGGFEASFAEGLYWLELNVDELFDGPHTCTPNHVEEWRDDFATVLLVDTEQRPWDSNSDVIDDSYEEPYSDGTLRVSLHLEKE